MLQDNPRHSRSPRVQTFKRDSSAQEKEGKRETLDDFFDFSVFLQEGESHITGDEMSSGAEIESRPEKLSFSLTCNLFSQYIREKGCPADLGLEMSSRSLGMFLIKLCYDRRKTNET